MFMKIYDILRFTKVYFGYRREIPTEDDVELRLMALKRLERSCS